MTIAQALPQYDWRYSIAWGYYLDFVDMYGRGVRYVPYDTPSLQFEIVDRDITTLVRTLTDVSRYDYPIRMDAGRLSFFERAA